MEKGKETKPTKEVEYQIEGSVFDAESGEPVAIKTANYARHIDSNHSEW